MKKVAVIVQSKDDDDAVRKLGALGVIHVEHQKVPAGKDIVSLKEDMVLIDKVIDVLSQEEFCTERGAVKQATTVKDWRSMAAHLFEAYTRFTHLKEYSRVLAARIAEWEIWGDFDPNEIRALAAKGVYIGLYRIPARDLKTLAVEDVTIKVVSAKGGTVNCVAISRKQIGFPFKELTLPKMSLAQMRARVAEDKGVMEKLKREICGYISYRTRFSFIKAAFETELKFHEAVRGMGQSGGISHIAGYVPSDVVSRVDEAAKKERWGIVVDEPAEEDSVPTLVRNPRWVSIISPVFKVIEIVPGYRELDISLWFLVFFSVFFGMLIGDAGYGLVYFILTLFAQKRWGRKARDKSVFVLFYILSLCAVIWGLLSGTFFGQEWLTRYMRPLMPGLQNDRTVQTFCFFLGALQLSLAHIWRSVKKFPSLRALSDIGWVFILWGGFFLAKLLILGETFPRFMKWFFIIGPIMVVLFSAPSKNIFKGIGAGLGMLLLNFVNSFTDIVSYIRLFAVGLATVAIADAFNSMALSVGFGGFFSGLATSLILILGHILNVILGPLAVLVHGVRLNVLEFCSHLDIKWLGFPYDPLRSEGFGKGQ